MGVKMNRKSIIVVGSLVAIVILGVVGIFGYSYASTPANIRTPEFEHYHLRTRLGNGDAKYTPLARFAFRPNVAAE